MKEEEEVIEEGPVIPDIDLKVLKLEPSDVNDNLLMVSEDKKEKRGSKK